MKKKKQSHTIRLLQIGVKDLVERTTFLHSVDQNKIGDTFKRSDLAEISERRIDQVPETRNKRLHSIRCIVLILSHNCIRS